MILKTFQKISQNLIFKKIPIPADIPESYHPVYRRIYKDKDLLVKMDVFDAVELTANIFRARNDPPAAALCEIATFFVNCGYPDMAESYHLLSLKLDNNPITYSLYLQSLLLSTNCSEKKMFKVAKRYEKLFLKKVKRYKTYSNNLTTDRRINIGYICHFFHNSVSQSLLTPYLKEHNRNRVKIVCYSDAEPNDVPEHIKQIPEVWRNTKNLNDEQLATLIREDEIDILLELNGHIVVNRYLTIAKKPAPIQISYYNIATTTGISAFDYIMLGDEISLNKSKSFYTESIYYMKGVCGIAKFPDTFPASALEPPCLKNGYITFGSFGGAQKINKEVVKLWSKVLKAVPTSHLYMKAGVLTFEGYLKSYRKLFTEEGIDLSRIHFEGFSDHHHMLTCYDKVDIALDSFPHAAGTTTAEASWQGVPVVTLAGERFSMQNGKAYLTSIGHPELVTFSQEEFIAKAKELATNPDKLIYYRKELRNDFKKSPRADAKAFAAKLEDAYLDMWARYCKKHG